MLAGDKKKLCFVVGPIGADDSEARIHADWLFEEIVTPVLGEHFNDFFTTRADKISSPGMIDTQVIDALLNADLVIADLTTLNPNAFYEIGIRHAIQKPIIHMHLEGERIPFDIAAFRSVKFSLKTPSAIRAARTALADSIRQAIAPGHKVENPVTFSRGKVDFDKTADSPQKVLENQMSAMLARLKSIERKVWEHDDVSAREYVGTRKRPPMLTMEVSVASAQRLSDLQNFIRDRLDSLFTGLRLIENNGLNQVIAMPDTNNNRAGLAELENEAKQLGIVVNTWIP
ncbi:hypothetical protein GYB73_08695 [Sinorhizobium meliloti]|nr:hypothetical protein [Sinorhizobium meliloti]MDW9636057.1 hypothetical protein [Sinorhizobium meliloti]MDW9810947.1 hypothetical protein [Sinorhizobium meliloti]MDX0124323.1 hypothetical protein [Sinorhizobium meliloti]MDX0333220.1 hypothetical protein [Sinorhizobium meliloti]